MKKQFEPMTFIILAAAFITALLIGGRILPAHGNGDEKLRDISSEQAVISPGASVEWKTYCRGCGHLYSYSQCDAVIGFSESELKRRFPEWDVIRFSRENVILERTIPGFCPRHYVLKLKGDILKVYRISEPELEETEFAEFSAKGRVFDPDDIEKLKTGMPFNSVNELHSFIESAVKEKKSERLQ